MISQPWLYDVQRREHETKMFGTSRYVEAEVATMEYSYEVREEVSRTVHGSEYAPIYRSLEAPLNVCSGSLFNAGVAEFVA
jgi:hypothetical protein